MGEASPNVPGLDRARDWLTRAASLAVLTGAGISAESGAGRRGRGLGRAGERARGSSPSTSWMVSWRRGGARRPPRAHLLGSGHPPSRSTDAAAAARLEKARDKSSPLRQRLTPPCEVAARMAGKGGALPACRRECEWGGARGFHVVWFGGVARKT